MRRPARDWSKALFLGLIPPYLPHVEPVRSAYSDCQGILTASTMSSTPHVTSTSPSSNFQLIFNTALKAYEKKTKRDLLAHPLASQLQACDCPGSILVVLQGQVDDLDQARKSNEKLTKWLSPTVNVLSAFSDTLGEGISLV
jgi:hypothetical protein